MKRELLCSLVLGGLLTGGALASPQVIDPDNGDNLQMKLEWMANGGHFPPSGLDAARDGGNGPADATPAVFSAGCYSDLGSTVGKGDDIQGAVNPTNCFDPGTYYAGVTGYSADAWYSFSIPTQSIVTLTTVHANTLYDTAVFIVAADGTTIVAGDDDFSGSPLWQAQISCNLPAGSYYAVIDGFGVGSEGQYQMSLCYSGFVCPAGAFTHDEGQDGCGLYGNIIDCNSTFCGVISSPADTDTYTCIVHNQVTPGHNNSLRLIVNGQGFGMDGTITVWDELCTTILAQLVGNGDGSTILNFCLPANTPFVVEVTGAAGTTGDYSIKLECRCCLNPGDPDINSPLVLTDASNWQGGATLPLNNCPTGLCSQFGRTSYRWLSIYVPDDPCWDTVIRYCGGGACAASPVWYYAPTGLFYWCPSCVGNGAWCAGIGDNYFYIDGWREPALNNQLLMQVKCCPDSYISVEYVYDPVACPPVDAGEQPAGFALSQNTPNPFNPTTSISFTLPEAGETSLKVYDMNGREVATLVNGMTERGEHTVTFDASELSSGVYFYTLQTGSLSTSKKMVLLK